MIKCICHDDAQKRKEHPNLLGVLPWAVTIDTTNKGSRPEIPRPGKGGKRWTIGSSDDVSISSTPLTRILALCWSVDTSNKGCCSRRR